MTVRALYKETVIAESDDTVVVEGDHCFAIADVNRPYLQDSSSHTTCSGKGEASSYSVMADGDWNADAAWHDPVSNDGAKEIRDRVAFWRDVKVVEG